MPRPIWKGHISFGLINIPITLYSAERRSDLHFNLIDSRNNAKVRYERVNEVTGEEVPWNAIVKGYEYADDSYVLLTEDDFKKADVEAAQTVAIESFIPRSEMDCLYFDKPYILAPGKKAEKGYVLLRETMKRTHTVGLARVVIRTREYMAALMPRGDALFLDLLRYHQEIRDPGDFDLPGGDIKGYKIAAKEIEMAERFIGSMTAKWRPEKYHDTYRENLMKWIEKKAKAGKSEEIAELEPPKEEAPADVNIMDLLQKSLARAGANGHRASEDGEGGAGGRPRKRARGRSRARRR